MEAPGQTRVAADSPLRGGDFVILHKLLPAVVIADFLRFDADGMMAEHWDVVQPIPEADYDPLRPSTENLDRFRAVFGITD